MSWSPGARSPRSPRRVRGIRRRPSPRWVTAPRCCGRRSGRSRPRGRPSKRPYNSSPPVRGHPRRARSGSRSRLRWTARLPRGRGRPSRGSRRPRRRPPPGLPSPSPSGRHRDAGAGGDAAAARRGPRRGAVAGLPAAVPSVDGRQQERWRVDLGERAEHSARGPGALEIAPAGVAGRKMGVDGSPFGQGGRPVDIPCEGALRVRAAEGGRAAAVVGVITHEVPPWTAREARRVPRP